MLVLLSPSKAMRFDAPVSSEQTSSPAFTERAHRLVGVMQRHTPEQLAKLMKLSDSLSELNAARYREFFEPTTPRKQAILAFSGDTYKDIPLESYTPEDFAHAQQRVRILSGLYGLLRPLDVIEPYRLEMGTRITGLPDLQDAKAKGLYAYWGDAIAEALLSDLQGISTPAIVNCASQEYAKAARLPRLKARGVRVIEPVFMDRKGEDYKVVSFWAKRARGMMADFIVRQRVETPKELEGFSAGGYSFDPERSEADRPVFLRG